MIVLIFACSLLYLLGVLGVVLALVFYSHEVDELITPADIAKVAPAWPFVVVALLLLVVFDRVTDRFRGLG